MLLGTATPTKYLRTLLAAQPMADSRPTRSDDVAAWESNLVIILEVGTKLQLHALLPLLPTGNSWWQSFPSLIDRLHLSKS